MQIWPVCMSAMGIGMTSVSGVISRLFVASSSFILLIKHRHIKYNGYNAVKCGLCPHRCPHFTGLDIRRSASPPSPAVAV